MTDLERIILDYFPTRTILLGAFAFILHLMSALFFGIFRWVLERIFKRLSLPAKKPPAGKDIFFFGIKRKPALALAIFTTLAFLPWLIDVAQALAMTCVPEPKDSDSADVFAPWWASALSTIRSTAIFAATPVFIFMPLRCFYLYLRYPEPMPLSDTDRILYRFGLAFYLSYLFVAVGTVINLMQTRWPCNWDSPPSL
ncbi:MAG: hypothetical protein Q8K65_08250 [Alphaproteobacteria bacterium]|nr:hypothetical protein [Alphaproteobacteria bacterium]